MENRDCVISSDSSNKAIVLHVTKQQQTRLQAAVVNFGDLPRPKRTPDYMQTTVPTFSPWTTRLRLLGANKSKTTMGILLSMHREKAVESITFSCF
jgi:hypothetical protein